MTSQDYINRLGWFAQGLMDRSGNPIPQASATATASPSSAANGTNNAAGYAANYQTAVAPTQRQNDALQKAYEERQTNLYGYLDRLGENQMRQASDYYSQQAGAVDQSAISRGLANSTIRNSLQAGVRTERSRALQEIGNNVDQQRLNYGAQLSKDTLDFAERYYGQDRQTALQLQLGQLQANTSMANAATQASSQANSTAQQTQLGYAQLAAQQSQQSNSPFSPQSYASNYNQVLQGNYRLANPGMPTATPTRYY